MNILRKCSYCFIAVCLVLCSCGGPKQIQCPTCNGTGKIQTSSNESLKFEVTEGNYKNNGVFNPDYFVYVTIKNLSDKGGNFKVQGIFTYKGIGDHIETTEEYIGAHSTKTVTIHYDADKECDNVTYNAIAPTAIITKEEICTTCGGKGTITK